MKKIVLLCIVLCSMVYYTPSTVYAYSKVDTIQDMVRIVRSHKDKVVILAIFASFCPPCKEEVPLLNSLHKEFGDRAIIQGLSLDEDLNALNTFIKETKPQYPIALLSHTIMQDIGVGIIPQLLIYKNGMLIKHVVGLIPHEELVKYIQ